MTEVIKEKNKGGRPFGSTAKSTKQAREAIAYFVNNNASRMQSWLDRIADDQFDKEGNLISQGNPVKAFEMFNSVIEYHIPKLSRAEWSLVGDDGGPINHNITVQFLD